MTGVMKTVSTIKMIRYRGGLFYSQLKNYRDWMSRTYSIYETNRLQDLEARNKLSTKWDNAVLYGEIDPWDLFLELGKVIDCTDNKLIGTSQYFHALRAFHSMLDDGVRDETLLFLALIHDIGKVLVLFGEEQHNVMCSTFIIDSSGDLCENLTISWNHDEFAYQKSYLDDPILWAIRHHSLNELFSEKKFPCILRQPHEKKGYDLATVLNEHDKGSKGLLYNPTINEALAKEIIYRFLPNPINF